MATSIQYRKFSCGFWREDLLGFFRTASDVPVETNTLSLSTSADAPVKRQPFFSGVVPVPRSEHQSGQRFSHAEGADGIHVSRTPASPLQRQA
ncbi:hypothetical protein MJ561_05385 [Klebsiella pneumoniae]|nr:hypothetical protein MJ561_05385 [Klebsiella pneumoniae]